MIHDLISKRGMSKTDFVMQSLVAMNVPPERHPQGDEAAPHEAVARVDWGRWIVDCPYCAGAALVDWGDPVHYCLSCHNERGEHRWVRVVLPTDEERRAIEEALEQLPEHEQHWTPGQTVEDVLAKRRPVQGPQAHYTMYEQLAQLAGEERDRHAARGEALERALAEERRGALLLIGYIEYLKDQLAAERARLQPDGFVGGIIDVEVREPRRRRPDN